MIDINLLRNDIEEAAKKLAHKRYKLDIEKFNYLENERRRLQIAMEDLQAKRNSASKQIGILKSKGEDTSTIMDEIAHLGTDLKALENSFSDIQKSLNDLLAEIPNILDDSVPIGEDETANKEIRRVGVPRNFDFQIKDHVDLGNFLDEQIDFEIASKLSGSRFYILKRKIAKLHRALAQFMLDMHIEEHGYTEMYVPYLVSDKTVYGTGQLPKFEADLFKTSKGGEDNLYLISTSEIPLTSMVADSIVKENDLPIKMVAHTPCFRSEAGSYGKDTRGMIRVHQFDKVEMVQIVDSKNSFDVLEEMTAHAENVLKKLGLPYRVMLLCSGDTGFGSAKTYDLEVWIPSQNTYREISSCSCMSDFQARRMQARVKRQNGKNEFVHTLNGSGLAVGRALVAVIENYQNNDGSITVPEVLRKYMGCDVIN
ncbi:MAG: serine--tRNA ligase [Neisseriaceae bacterium]